ncbi:MAG: hypothetical protein Q8736_02830, partial [Sweet potato little leaf phytoplasma]|nr:hypothetical protein [Sweet potato little leaf phytoplasma]
MRAEPSSYGRGRREDRGYGGRRDQREQRPKIKTKYDEYTPLTAPKSQILKEILQTDLRTAQRPPTLRKSAQKDRSKYCDFHAGYGHTTDQCTWIRDLIEDMIRDGKLQQYVPDALKRQARRRSPSPEE